MASTNGAKKVPRISRLSARVLLGLLLLGLLVVPWLAGSYVSWLVGNILVLILFAAGFNLLFGYSGLLSFGHAGFFAVGAYVCAKILLAVPSFFLAQAAGVLAAGLVSAVIGFFCIRHTRIYFAMLTLSFGMMIHSIIWKWRSVTGGDDGLFNVPVAPLSVPGLFSIDMNRTENYYYFLLIVVVLCLVLLWRLVHSPLGLVFQGIRDSETRVAFCGLSIQKYRLIVFTISGMYAGLSGVLAVPLAKAAYPGMAHWTFSAEPVLACLLGGAKTFAGPVVGAVLLFVIKEIIVRFTEYWSLVLGVTVILLVLAFRGGVVSVLEKGLLPRLVPLVERGVKVDRVADRWKTGKKFRGFFGGEKRGLANPGRDAYLHYRSQRSRKNHFD
ncbi:MAG: branched-chain amino acid ABC transporter permease [Bacillota bacterium]